MNYTMFPLQDNQARIEAVENNNQNIIVEAGAGTGKTTLLVQKMLFLVLVKKVKLSRLVALTFTKKAAASLKQKLEENLHKAYQILLLNSFVLTADEENFNKRLADFEQNKQEMFLKFRPLFLKSGLTLNELFALLKTALEEVPLCQIGTIHSFCNFILKKYAIEADLNINMEIDEGDLINIIFDKYWALFLEEELTLNNSKKEIWLSLLKQVSLQDLRAFARSLCTPRFEDYSPINNYKFLENQAQRYIDDANALIQTHPDESNVIITLKEAIKSLNQIKDFYQRKPCDFKDFNLYKRLPSKLKDWSTEDLRLARKIVAFAKNYNLKSQKFLADAYYLLKPFAQKVQKEMLKQNYLTFDEIIFKTHHLILNNKAVRQELKLSYDKIFIDEFQDTDPMQGEIMLFLSETLDTFANKWQDLILQQGKLFIVGDPKQSIYRFRGADISAYQEFCNLLKNQGAKVCDLQNNFRSAKKIIDYVNTFGKSQFEYKQNLQTEYKEIYPSKQIDNARLELYLYQNTEGNSKPNLRRVYATCIAKWISENAKKTKKSDGSILEYKDIALLISTTTDLNVFLDALKENNIPYNVEEDENFYSSQEVLDFINILKVIKNPQNKTALLGVLRSPVCLISDEILLKLSKQNKLDIYAEVDNQKIQNTYKKLKDLRSKLIYLNPVEIVNETAEIFNFTTYQTLASLEEQPLANIIKFKQIVQKLFEAGSYTLEQLLDNFETYQKERDEESSAILAEESFNVVKILTIHKAKGLEFPVVILTDLSKTFSQGDNRGVDKKIAFYSRNLGLKGLKIGDIEDKVIPLIKEEKAAQEFEEKRRLLYVAITRAKEALIIVDSIKKEDKSFTQFLSDAGCWPTEKLEESVSSAKVFYQKYNTNDFNFNIQENKEDKKFSFNYPAWKNAFENREKEYKTYLKNTDTLINDNVTLYPSPEVEHAIKVGSLCHKILQTIFTNNQLNFDAETDKDALKEAKEIVNSFCKTPAYQELKNMEFLASEFPITTIENEIVKNGFIDALFKTKTGNIKLIDFKSDKIKVVTAKTVEENYLKQIAFYKDALSKIFKGKIEAALVYLRPAEIYNIED